MRRARTGQLLGLFVPKKEVEVSKSDAERRGERSTFPGGAFEQWKCRSHRVRSDRGKQSQRIIIRENCNRTRG